MNEQTRQQLRSMRIWLWAGAVLGVVLCIPAGIFWPRELMTAYLAASMWAWSLSCGSLAFLMIFTLTGGKWGEEAWPWMALLARLMPLVGLLCVPWLCRVQLIYPWADPHLFDGLEHVSHRIWLYLIPFYIGRTVCYFIIWSGLTWLATGSLWHSSISKRAELPAESRMTGGEAAAGLGLVAILLTVTWAGFDWVMSLDPFFSSTLFGALIGIGAMMSAIAALVAAVCLLPVQPGSPTPVDYEKTLGDLSNLLLAFVMLWAYFSFAHYLIMWEGNQPIEANFYATRIQGFWGWLGPGLAVAGFIIPFLCLLNYDFKRTPRKVGCLAFFLLAVRMLELDWFIMPTSGESALSWSTWSILPASLAVVSIYGLGFVTLMDWNSKTCEAAT